MSKKDKLLEIVSKEKTKTIERNKLRIKYRWFIRIVNRLKLWLLNATDFNCLKPSYKTTHINHNTVRKN